MTEYKPDSWVVLKMKGRDQTLYKVLGGWSGGYLNGDSWRLNSGVTKVEYDVTNDQWRFHGSSGSVYVVNPESYGLRMSTAHIYETMIKTYPDQDELLENLNWEEVDWTN
jgi:hypothetical protein